MLRRCFVVLTMMCLLVSPSHSKSEKSGDANPGIVGPEKLPSLDQFVRFMRLVSAGKGERENGATIFRGEDGTCWWKVAADPRKKGVVNTYMYCEQFKQFGVTVKWPEGKWDAGRKAWVWYGDVRSSSLLWTHDGALTMSFQPFEWTGLMLRAGEPPKFATMSAGMPVSIASHVVSIDDSTDTRIVARMGNGATYVGGFKRKAWGREPSGYGRLVWSDELWFMGKFREGLPSKGVFFEGTRDYPVAQIIDGVVHKSEWWSRSGDPTDNPSSMLRNKEGIVSYYDEFTNFEMLRYADGTFSEGENPEREALSDAYVRAKDEEWAERVRSLNPVNVDASRVRAFELSARKESDGACRKCNGTGQVYEWASVTQEKVFRNDVGWTDGTVHRSGSLKICSRCNGTGKR
ncbi:MAG: hypothetical protein AAB011_08080 [Candidatus Eisenbacteria bacterium]